MKILLCSDDPRMHSGYGKITKMMAHHLKACGHEVLLMGHTDLSPGPFQSIDWEGFRLWSIRGYGNAEFIRWFLKHEEPDVILANADPHFFAYLFKMDNEVRQQCPLLFYHLWDDTPFPAYNLPYYESCDRILAGSAFTHKLLTTNPDITKGVLDNKVHYVPIGFDPTIYKPLSEKEKIEFHTNFMTATNNRHRAEFIVGYVGRNAPRKQLMSILDTWHKWQKDKPEALLFIHAPEQDASGNLEYVMRTLYSSSQILFSQSNSFQQPNELINQIYNFCDVMLNRSSAEGFGMPIAEAMLAGTPCISIDTQGPAGLITEDTGWLLPADVIPIGGSGPTPFVGERYVTDAKFMAALDDAYYNRDVLKQKATKCRQRILDHYSLEQFNKCLEEAIAEARRNWVPYPEYTVMTFPEIDLSKSTDGEVATKTVVSSKEEK